MIFVNQSPGFLQVDIINCFTGENNILICGSAFDRKGLNNNIKIITSINYSKKNILTRFFTWLIFTIHVYFIIKFKTKNSDKYFFVSNPPFLIWLCLIKSIESNVLIFDLYPNVIQNTFNLNDSNIFIRVWNLLNNSSLRNAKNLFTVSESMKLQLINQTKLSNVNVVYNWAPNLNQYYLCESHIVDNIKGKFVILYSGNMGKTHDLEVLIELANKLHYYPVFHFLFIGDGSKLNKLKNQTKKFGLKNITFYNYLPWNDFYNVLSMSSVGVVSISRKLDNNILPSKLYTYLKFGLPILSICNLKSELADFVRRYDIGKSFESDNLDEMYEFITNLCNDKARMEKYSQSSIAASALFTSENAKKYLSIINNDNNTR